MSALKRVAKSLLPRRLWTWLRVARIRRKVRRYRRRTVSHTFAGFPLTVCLADPLAEGWYDHDWDEMHEITLLKNRSLRPGARVFDLGAHQCVVGLVLARIVGPGGQVVAVEANPHNARMGEINRDLNDCPQLVVRHAAAAATAGTLVFNLGMDGQVDDGTGAWGRQEVPAVTIDGLAREYGPPDVLFIDVEGFEVPVLRGAEQTLARRPDCMVEVHVGCGLEKLGGSVDAVLSFFPEEHYERFVHSERQLRPVPLAEGLALTRDRFFLTALRR